MDDYFRRLKGTVVTAIESGLENCTVIPTAAIPRLPRFYRVYGEWVLIFTVVLAVIETAVSKLTLITTVLPR